MKQKNKTILLSWLISCFSLGLAACGGDGIGGTGITPTIDGALARSNEKALTSYFQDSINNNQGNPKDGQTPEVSFSLDLTSSTNLQESGVDEADLIKTDGQYIYSVKKIVDNNYKNASTIPLEETASDIIRIMGISATGKLQEVNRFASDKTKEEKPWNVAGLYLHEPQKKLIALSSEKQNYYQNWFTSQYFANQTTKVLLIDVTNPSTSKIDSKISFQGQLIDSRRNGDTLYMVLRHYPDYEYINQKNPTETTLNDYLPTYQVDNSAKQLITQADNCYLEAGKKGSADVITLVAIDLISAAPEINSLCYVGSAEAIYASQEALYLATTRWGYQTTADNDVASYNPEVTTDIHKFNYNGLNFDYRGSGEVDGHLGYRQSSKSFRFSEHNGMLRVVTFDEDQWISILQIDDNGPQVANSAPFENTEKSPISISILQENASKKTLELVSKLPNKNRPDPIGLPREQLYATRFIGDRAFVVTFRVTDPLYVLDLSDPSDPFIAGELKVDGYSDYLHPITENLLLGLGKDAIPSGTGDNQRGAWYQGVKLSLIDVADPSNPREVDKVIIGKRGTQSTALSNHHALTSLRVGDNHLVAIPVELHQEDSPDYEGRDIASFFHKYKQTGLHRFEVNINSQKIETLPVLEVANAQSDVIRPITNDRSVIIGDNIYYMHDGNFWQQDWSGDNNVIGPK